MGIMLSKLLSYFYDKEQKVIIVGLDNAGKTTILYQFLMNEVVHTSPTIGSNVEEIVVKNVHFFMWDIGGQESLRSSWQTYYSNTHWLLEVRKYFFHVSLKILFVSCGLFCYLSPHFVLLVIDSTDKHRLETSRTELNLMLQHDDLNKSNLLVLANKQDVKGCLSAAEISNSLQLDKIKDHNWHIQPCCALTGDGLNQGLKWMLSQCGEG